MYMSGNGKFLSKCYKKGKNHRGKNWDTELQPILKIIVIHISISLIYGGLKYRWSLRFGSLTWFQQNVYPKMYHISQEYVLI